MTRKRGRPYQPLPRRQNRTAVAMIVLVALVLVIGFVIMNTGR